jgi:hypothetical protein
MYRILTASKDTYITNKIINNNFRAVDANVGNAGTLDLFKLYAESTSGSDNKPTELSRVLIKFDLDPIRNLTGSTVDIAHSTFKCFLNLTDVYGGQTTPSNFKLIVFPLANSFDEGTGRDIISFEDLGSSNWVTASTTESSVSAWFATGANYEGLLGSNNIDIIGSGTVGSGLELLWKSQTFEKGSENLSIDVTKIVSATIAGAIPDHGFRISFSGSQETDKRTRFVKRFASRHATTVENRPKIVFYYNDSIQDHHESFFFNLTGSLFLNNFHRGAPENILSGSSATGVSGNNCIVVRLVSGTDEQGTYFSKSITGSQHKVGDNFITGVYSATFAISEFASGTLRNEIINAASATFKTYWGSTDYTVGYHTSSLVINNVNRTSFSNAPSKLFINITNLVARYNQSQKVRLRVFVENFGREVTFTKTPLESKSEIYNEMYYRVRDAINGKVVIPFETTYNSTLLSTDSDGMYFDFYMDALPTGRTYVFDFLIKDFNSDRIFSDVGSKFRIDK